MHQNLNRKNSSIVVWKIYVDTLMAKSQELLAAKKQLWLSSLSKASGNFNIFGFFSHFSIGKIPPYRFSYQVNQISDGGPLFTINSSGLNKHLIVNSPVSKRNSIRLVALCAAGTIFAVAIQRFFQHTKNEIDSVAHSEQGSDPDSPDESSLEHKKTTEDLDSHGRPGSPTSQMPLGVSNPQNWPVFPSSQSMTSQDEIQNPSLPDSERGENDSSKPKIFITAPISPGSFQSLESRFLQLPNSSTTADGSTSNLTTENLAAHNRLSTTTVSTVFGQGSFSDDDQPRSQLGGARSPGGISNSSRRSSVTSGHARMSQGDLSSASSSPNSQSSTGSRNS